MLRESGGAIKDKGGRLRRCFVDGDFELHVLSEPDGCMFGFQLLYRSGSESWFLSWTPVEEFLHFRVDVLEDGKRRFTQTDPGECLGDVLLERLRPAAALLEPRIRSFVLELLHHQPADVHRCRYCSARQPSRWSCPSCWLRACDGCMEAKALRKSRCTRAGTSHEWQLELAEVPR